MFLKEDCYGHVGHANQSANFILEDLAIAQGNLSVKFVFSSLLCPFDFQSPRKQEYDDITNNNAFKRNPVPRYLTWRKAVSLGTRFILNAAAHGRRISIISWTF